MIGRICCDHRKLEDINPDFLKLIHDIEQILGYDLTATSVCRCPDCNRIVGGESHSAHQKESHNDGLACAGDFEVNASDVYEIFKTAIDFGVKRIGIKRKSGQGGFIHLDIAKESDGFPQPRIWTY